MLHRGAMNEQRSRVDRCFIVQRCFVRRRAFLLAPNWFSLVTSLAILFFVTANNARFTDYMNRARLNANKDRLRADLFNTVDTVSGVYKDKGKASKLGIEDTVLLTVASFSASDNHHYRKYLKNLLCFFRHYELEALVYVLNTSGKRLERERNDDHYRDVRLLSYPEELFWGLVANKTTPIRQGKGHGDYSSSTPSFQSHGALVMLVPTLEVLQLGFNVIYLDIDLGLPMDPIPWLIRGKADMTMSLEMKHCPEVYSSTNPTGFQWSRMEPNTGVMHVRSNPQGIQLFHSWLERIVATNVLNDQKEYKVDVLSAEFDPSCNPFIKEGTYNATSLSSNSGEQRNPTYCYLPEIVVQNGMIAFSCAGKPGYQPNWYSEMYQYGVRGPSTIEGQSGRFPAIVHANYCNSKTRELSVRGLWLLDESANGSTAATSTAGSSSKRTSYIKTGSTEEVTSCLAYNASSTWYANQNWTKEFDTISSEREELLKTVWKSGTIFRRRSSTEVYLIDANLTRRVFPNSATFEQMGFQWENVAVIPDRLVALIPLGDPLPSVDMAVLHRQQAQEIPPGTLIRPFSLSRICLIDGKGRSRMIASKDIFEALGFSWEKVIVIPDDVNRYLIEGEPITESSFEEVYSIQMDTITRNAGFLLRTKEDDTIFIVDQFAMKRRIPTAEVFTAAGLNWSNVRIVSKEVAERIPTADPISTAADVKDLLENRAPKFTPVQKFSTVASTSSKDSAFEDSEGRPSETGIASSSSSSSKVGKKRGKSSKSAKHSSISSSSSSSSFSKTRTASGRRAMDPTILLRQHAREIPTGTLIRAPPDQTVYLIDAEGAAHRVASQEVFAALHLRFEDVVDISAEVMLFVEQGQPLTDESSFQDAYEAQAVALTRSVGTLFRVLPSPDSSNATAVTDYTQQGAGEETVICMVDKSAAKRCFVSHQVLIDVGLLDSMVVRNISAAVAELIPAGDLLESAADVRAVLALNAQSAPSKGLPSANAANAASMVTAVATDYAANDAVVVVEPTPSSTSGSKKSMGESKSDENENGKVSVRKAAATSISSSPSSANSSSLASGKLLRKKKKSSSLTSSATTQQGLSSISSSSPLTSTHTLSSSTTTSHRILTDYSEADFSSVATESESLHQQHDLDQDQRQRHRHRHLRGQPGDAQSKAEITKKVMRAGALFRAADSTEIFLMDEKMRRRPFPNIETFNNMGFKHENVLVASLELVQGIPLGDALPSVDVEEMHRREYLAIAKNATLIKGPRKRTVYFIDEHRRARAIPDMDTAQLLNLDLTTLLKPSKSIFSFFEIGEPISAANYEDIRRSQAFAAVEKVGMVVKESAAAVGSKEPDAASSRSNSEINLNKYHQQQQQQQQQKTTMKPSEPSIYIIDQLRRKRAILREVVTCRAGGTEAGAGAEAGPTTSSSPNKNLQEVEKAKLLERFDQIVSGAVEYAPEVLAHIPDGDPLRSLNEVSMIRALNLENMQHLNLKNGSLVVGRSSSGSKYILDEFLRKRLVPDVDTLAALGLKPEDERVVPQELLDALDTGEPIPKQLNPDDVRFMEQLLTVNGGLIKSRRGAAIYYIENGVRREIPSVDLFNEMKLNWKKIMKISPDVLAAIPMGPPMSQEDADIMNKVSRFAIIPRRNNTIVRVMEDVSRLVQQQQQQQQKQQNALSSHGIAQGESSQGTTVRVESPTASNVDVRTYQVLGDVFALQELSKDQKTRLSASSGAGASAGSTSSGVGESADSKPLIVDLPFELVDFIPHVDR